MSHFPALIDELSVRLSQPVEHGKIETTEWFELAIENMSFLFLRQPFWPEGVTIYGRCGPLPPVHREQVMLAAMEANFVTAHHNAPVYGFDRDSEQLVSIYKVPLHGANAGEVIERLQAVVRQCEEWIAAGLVTLEENAA